MYQKIIMKALEELRCLEFEARLVEAWMRLEHRYLDGLSPAQFKQDARVGLAAARADPRRSEELAQSFGL